MGAGTRQMARLLAVLALATGGAAQAASFGHARLVSEVGQPLLVLVPVTHLTAADLQALSARPAAAADWASAGLTPPVPLDSLSVSVAPEARGSTRRVLRIHSSQAFSGALADLLLDVQTATGAQRYQVSIVAPGPVRAQAPVAQSQTAPASSPASAVGAPAAPTSRRIPAGAIRVRPGDTLFAIARRHAVDGVSLYQLMMALQRANPQAFIRHNINLVRAGAALAVPGIDDMLSISDAEARRQFVQQTAAFDRLSGRVGAGAAPLTSGTRGAVSHARGADHPAGAATAKDQLRLSQGGAAESADQRTARGHALKDAEARVGQLQDNVQNLNKALQAQGRVAGHAAVDGAQAIGQSIGKIANAISEASHEAAAQANAQTAAEALDAQQPDAADAAPGSDSAAGQVGASARPGASATAKAGTDLGTTLAPAAPAQADAAELQASQRAQHRATWLQDHLLGVMTTLLAVIVFIIAWLLRRANGARDDAEDTPRVTEAMVREKLKDVDLDLAQPDAPSAPKA
ncbi:FimV/HubP family polar landmark protein [Castellaniella caeni]